MDYGNFKKKKQLDMGGDGEWLVVVIVESEIFVQKKKKKGERGKRKTICLYLNFLCIKEQEKR